MGNEPLDTSLLDKAILFAVRAHSGTERRGKGFPYVVHPLEAVAIAATITNDQEVLSAAVLHDVVEDTEIPLRTIERKFGLRVARLVASESDSPDGSWRERKQQAIDRLASAPLDAKVVAMGDKLSNMRAIARDYARQGDDLWNIFHAPGGRADHEWHYRGLAASLFALCDTDPYREFVSLISQVFGSPEDRPPHLVSLADYEESGGGFNSVSYNCRDGVTMVKFYDASRPIAVPQQELRLSRLIWQRGIPTPAPGRLVTDGARCGVEFRRVHPKESFSRYVSNRPESVEEIGVRFARLARRLHATPCDTGAFPSAALRCLARVEAFPLFSEAQRQQAVQFVRSVPSSDTCLHGDMQVGNVITSGGPLSRPDSPQPVLDQWIDVGDFAWGNPLFDLGCWYVVAHWNPEELTRRLYHISNAQMCRIYEAFVREYADVRTPDQMEAFDGRVRPFAALRMLEFPQVVAESPQLKAWVWEALGLSGE